MRQNTDFTLTFDEHTLPIIEQISEGLPGGFFICYAHGNQELLHINSALLRIFGCETAEEFKELTGYTFRGLFPQEDHRALEESIRAQMLRSAHDLYYVEQRIARKDGVLRWVDAYGHFVSTKAYGDLFYVFIEDVTERRQKRLAESGRMNEALYETRIRGNYFKAALLHDTISCVEINLTRDEFIAAFIMSDEGKVEDFFSFMGITPFEKYSHFVRFWADFVEPDEAEHYDWFFDIDRLIGCYEKGERMQTYDSWAIDMYGRRRLNHYLFFLEKNEHTGDVIALSLLRDITEQVERQQLLQSVLRQAETQRLARNTFFANMSHDIRTPLNAIIGYAELLKSHVGDPGKVGECIEKIHLSSEQLLAIFTDFLNDSQNEAARVELLESECHLVELIREVARDAAQPLKAKKIDFSLDSSELVHGSVEVDYIRLREILTRLLDNAIKYAPPEGKVKITVREQKEGDARQGLAMYQFLIEDNGCGIPQERQEEIFLPPEPGKGAAYPGASNGGLALVKSHVEALGGSVAVESREGEGSCFTVSVPMRYPVRGAFMDPENAALEAESEGDARIRILLVEDNAINRDIERELLRNYGYAVETACDGGTAYEMLKASAHGYYSLVLMDIQMPGMDGYEAARAIRGLENEALSRIPIIALSSNALKEDYQKSKEAGLNAHFTKPIDMEALQELIREVLQK